MPVTFRQPLGASVLRTIGLDQIKLPARLKRALLGVIARSIDRFFYFDVSLDSEVVNCEVLDFEEGPKEDAPTSCCRINGVDLPSRPIKFSQSVGASFGGVSLRIVFAVSATAMLDGKQQTRRCPDLCQDDTWDVNVRVFYEGSVTVSGTFSFSSAAMQAQTTQSGSLLGPILGSGLPAGTSPQQAFAGGAGVDLNAMAMLENVYDVFRFDVRCSGIEALPAVSGGDALVVTPGIDPFGAPPFTPDQSPCAVPPEIASWPANTEGSFEKKNNCYNYATNTPAVALSSDRTGAQPGQGGRGIDFTRKFLIDGDPLSCDVLRDLLQADGLVPVPRDGNERAAKCSPCCYKVAAMLNLNRPEDPNSGQDFHFLRQSPDGTWAHKPGSDPATNLDRKGDIIDDPEAAMKSGSLGDYNQFCGFFCVCKNKRLKIR